MRLNESFTIFKLATVTMIAFGGICVLIAHIFDPNSSLSGATDWYSKNWFHSRPSVSGGFPIEWTNIGWWELLGHYSTALYAGLWAYDGWDNVSLFYITLQYHVFFRTMVDSATVPNIGQNHPEGAMSRKNCVMSCSISNNIPPSTILPSSVSFAYCTWSIRGTNH